MAKPAKTKDHRFENWRFGYAKCTKCGLIALKNEATRKEMKKPCKGTPEA